MPPEPRRATPASRNVSPALTSTELDDARRLLLEETASVALLVLDRRGHVLTWSKGAERIKGWRAEEIIGQHISVFYPPEAVAADHPQRELDLAAVTGRYSEDGWRVRKDGTRFWARVTITALNDEEGHLRYFGKATLDLTSDRQKDEQIQNVLKVLDQTMRLDHLTGLPNRRAWDESIDELLRDSGASATPLVIAILDLDNFADYNERHGHVGGDGLLKRCAQLWRDTLREGDVLARYGGEEFVVALPGCTPTDAEPIVERMRSATPGDCTVSAGIAAREGEESGSDVISRADRALYEAKQSGRDRVRLAPVRDDASGHEGRRTS